MCRALGAEPIQWSMRRTFSSLRSHESLEPLGFIFHFLILVGAAHANCDTLAGYNSAGINDGRERWDASLHDARRARNIMPRRAAPRAKTCQSFWQSQLDASATREDGLGVKERAKGLYE